MTKLADRIRESRKITVTVGDITFTGTRATSEHLASYMMGNTLDAQVARNHINGWDGVKESDLFPDGSNKLIDFDRDTFEEIIGDKPEWYRAIAQAVLNDATERIKHKVENAKK